MKNLWLIFLLLFIVCAKAPLQAQEPPRQAVNICALAIPLMNMYVVNYEYLLQERHGLASRVEFVPSLKGADTEGNAWAVVLDYRWHVSPKLGGFFVGPYARYRYAYGSGTAEGTDYDFTVPEFHLGINGGFRLVTGIGFNILLAAGYGYSLVDEKLTPASADTGSAFDAFKTAEGRNESVFDAPWYGEFSIGWAF